LQEKYPDAPDTLYAACIGRLVYYRYINPAIVYVRLNICGFTG
jgi:Ras GTPase-activating-like protein IQGAP2/3